MARHGGPSVWYGMMVIARDPAAARIASVVRDCLEPRRVVLFGSRARGDAHAESDWDVYVEVDDADVREGDWRSARGLELRVQAALRAAGLWSDVFVRTKRCFDESRDDPGTVEWDVAREGDVLYTRPGASGARVHERPASHRSIAGWLAKADEDFEMMEMAVTAGTYPPRPVAFHAHAGCEKLLEALLVSLGRRPRRTHSLAKLLAQAPSDVRDRMADAAALLDTVFPRTEYPVPGAGPVSRAEAESAVRAARSIREAVRPLVPAPTAEG